ncbi:MAG TPA: carbamoyltransferase C-terminal domain-containing protein [Verrucomicrobiota bacterium]|nr:carbamoyltransferase C-terminal domain-containing protein [Verrucomicrobiota bacterium]HQB16137.1 carbamoyltransferase C-terminal domain-containing protein [Verrucomicrobiota bacterium]
MIVLGLGGMVGHDPAAALVVDGRVVAAAEEERFLRDKHAKGKQAECAAQFCLQFAGLKPAAVQVVAIPFAPVSIFSPARWHFAARHWYAPDRAFTALFNGNRRFRRNVRNVLAALDRLGVDRRKIQFIPVEHHLAHASSAYHLSGYEQAAIMSVDGVGEYCTTWFGHGRGGDIHPLKEFFAPDSLGGCYGAITEYLGFEMLDGEFKVMGMAPYGDARRIDVSPLIQWNERGFRVNTRLVNCIGWRRHKRVGRGGELKGTYFSPKLIEQWGPVRVGDEIDDPYVHIAAAVQQQLEDILMALTRHFLGRHIARTKRLCYAGGVALNVKANQRLIQMMGPGHELFVQPAASDAGTALGAATYAAHQLGDRIQPMAHAYLGPEYSPDEIEAVLRKREIRYERCASITDTASELLAKGEVVAWFQGRMEFGPRALGNRSILGNPASRGVADRINAQIKYRERWRPFCPSLLDTVAPDVLQTTHPSPYMTFTFDVADHWKPRIPEVVHEDGTARPQIVTAQSNPRYYELLKKFEARTGIGVLLNTSLNRRGEPMVCSPDDALNMFFGSDLQNLALGDFLVRK